MISQDGKPFYCTMKEKGEYNKNVEIEKLDLP